MRPGIETLILFLILGIDLSRANLLTDIPKHNPLNIDWYPAPSPEDGPPLSAHASRNKALLPAQISGILGSYVLCIGVIFIGVLLVIRKKRRNLMLAEKSLDIEMQESQTHEPRHHLPPLNTNTTNPPRSPPVSPRNFSRPSLPPTEKGGPTPYVFPGGTTSPKSPTSPYTPQTPRSIENPYVDAKVLERDQHMLQRDLEDIYAHVMEQEEAKARGISVSSLPPPAGLQSDGPPSEPRRVPSQKKIEKRRPSNIDVDQEKTHSRSSSILSSILSPRKSKLLGKPRISSPISSPRWRNEVSNDEENEPLTPRYYEPGAPPPVPTDQVPEYHTRPTSDLKSPTVSIAEQLGASQYYKPSPTQSSFVGSVYDERPYHRQNPSQISLPRSHRKNPSQSSAAPVQEPAQNAEHTSTTSAAASTRTLPLRRFEPAVTSPSYASFALSTKTTTFERPDRARGPLTGPLTGTNALSPGAVPYSPYQPFTPMVPVTPRLVTREERKLKEKMMKKSGAQTPKEMVKSEDELWDSAY